jgi:hypothetical protein
MEHCIHHQHWSDHGGSFPTEEVAAWILGMLPEMYGRLKTVELNMCPVFAAPVRYITYMSAQQKHVMFAIRHGKDIADSMGSIIVRWLDEKATTLEGLKPNLDDIVDYLRTCIKEHVATGGNSDIVILPWKPTIARPKHHYRLTLGNMKMSNSKMMKRDDDDKIVQYVSHH